MNVVSFGGGTNSTAMIIGMYLHKIPIDLILFADPGGEQPHTYEFIKTFNEWLMEHGLDNKKEADAQRIAYQRRLAQGYPRNIPEERLLRLAAYEDTGLEPEAFQAAMQDFSNHLMEHTQFRDTGTAEEFRALKDAEQKRQAGCVRCESPCQTCMIGCFKQEPDTCGGYTLPPMQYFCKTCGRDLRGESYDDNR